MADDNVLVEIEFDEKLMAMASIASLFMLVHRAVEGSVGDPDESSQLKARFLRYLTHVIAGFHGEDRCTNEWLWILAEELYKDIDSIEEAADSAAALAKEIPAITPLTGEDPRPILAIVMVEALLDFAREQCFSVKGRKHNRTEMVISGPAMIVVSACQTWGIDFSDILKLALKNCSTEDQDEA